MQNKFFRLPHLGITILQETLVEPEIQTFYITSGVTDQIELFQNTRVVAVDLTSKICLGTKVTVLNIIDAK